MPQHLKISIDHLLTNRTGKSPDGADIPTSPSNLINIVLLTGFVEDAKKESKVSRRVSVQLVNLVFLRNELA
jgi:hypothetical protein